MTDVFEEARNLPDGSEPHCEPISPTTSETSDSEHDVSSLSGNEDDNKKLKAEEIELDTTKSIVGTRRLNCFVLCTQSEDQDIHYKSNDLRHDRCLSFSSNE